LAPEIITPARKGSAMPVMETKVADVFAFAMFAVEVFTGKIPFDEQKNEAVVLRISRGGRPDMPGNAQALGLTAEMWELLESCWHQNPKKRPTMGEVVRRWQKFVENINDDRPNVFPPKPHPAEDRGEGTSRRRVRTEATRPRANAEPFRPRTTSDIVHTGPGPNTNRLRVTSDVGQFRTTPDSGRLRTTSAAGTRGVRLDAIPQSPASDATQRSPRSEAIQQRGTLNTASLAGTQVYDPPPTPKRNKCFCGLF